jgi:hypothetical protein
VEPGPQPPQVEPIPTQVDTVPKVSAIRREVFNRRRTRHGLLASASILCRETSSLYCSTMQLYVRKPQIAMFQKQFL